MVYLRNISVDTLHKGDAEDNNNNNILLSSSSPPTRRNYSDGGSKI
jgi:hypothetical protein